jgi:hypothetical protein
LDDEPLTYTFGSANSGSQRLIGSVSSSRPRSTRIIAATDVIGLLME